MEYLHITSDQEQPHNSMEVPAALLWQSQPSSQLSRAPFAGTNPTFGRAVQLSDIKVSRILK